MPIVCPFKIELPPPKPLHEMILQRFHEFGDVLALEEDGMEGEPLKMTCQDIRRSSINLANNLLKLGFRKNDVIAVYLENRIHFAPLMLAISSLGGAVSGVNPIYTVEELQRQIKDSGSRFVFTKKALLQKVQQACSGLSDQVRHIILVDGIEGSVGRGLVPLNDLYKGNFQQFPNVAIDCKEDVVLLPYSSGTTGLPKGVMLTHANLAALFFAKHSRGAYRGGKVGDATVLVLPFFHVAGFMALMLGVYNGSRSIVMTKLDSIRYVALVAKHKATFIMCVPTTLVYLSKHKEAQNYDLSSVTAVAFGAAPAGKELIEGVMKRFPNLALIQQGYGMTETGGLATANPHLHPSKYLMGSCGIPIPTIEIKVVDEKNNELGPMQKGEICIRGPSIMKGYMNNEKATRETIDKDGWLHSGDLGYYDHFAHVYIIERLKELIKYKGFQVAPAELEDLILRHPSIQEVGVVGLPDPKDIDIGEMTTAFVVLKPGFAADSKTEESIKKLVADHLAPYKFLRGGVRFCQSLPKGPSGKILRRDIR